MKQLKIANFFGEAEQILKAHEEFDEIKEALENYCNDQNKGTLKHLLNEANDLVNVLEGLYVQTGGCLREIHFEKEFKLYRTVKIINKIPENCTKKVKVYNSFRKVD